MKVILLADVKKLGKKGETIEVTTPRGVNKFQIIDFS